MEHALLNFGFFTYRSHHHGSKIWQKIHVGVQLWSRWRSDPQVAQLFCSRRTIMARALLNFGFFTYRLPHHGSKNAKNNSRRGVQRSASRTIMARALLNCGCLAVSRTADLRIDNKSPIFFAGLAQ